MLHEARWKCRTQKIAKIPHLGTIAPLCRAISSQLRHVRRIYNREKLVLDSNISPTCTHNMANFGPLAAEIGWRVWGHPCTFQLVSRLGNVTARHSSSGRQPNCDVEQMVPSIFGRAAITLGIGPHSSTIFFE